MYMTSTIPMIIYHEEFIFCNFFCNHFAKSIKLLITRVLYALPPQDFAYCTYIRPDTISSYKWTKKALI